MLFTNHETRITKHGSLMSQPSSIDRLPSEAREALHGWLRDPAITQTEAPEQPVEKRAGLHFSPRGEAKCVRGPRSNTVFRVFTNHESRNTNHGLFTAYFGRRVVRNAG